MRDDDVTVEIVFGHDGAAVHGLLELGFEPGPVALQDVFDHLMAMMFAMPKNARARRRVLAALLRFSALLKRFNAGEDVARERVEFTCERAIVQRNVHTIRTRGVEALGRRLRSDCAPARATARGGARPRQHRARTRRASISRDDGSDEPGPGSSSGLIRIGPGTRGYPVATGHGHVAGEGGS